MPKAWRRSGTHRGGTQPQLLFAEFNVGDEELTLTFDRDVFMIGDSWLFNLAAFDGDDRWYMDDGGDFSGHVATLSAINPFAVVTVPVLVYSMSPAQIVDVNGNPWQAGSYNLLIT